MPIQNITAQDELILELADAWLDLLRLKGRDKDLYDRILPSPDELLVGLNGALERTTVLGSKDLKLPQPVTNNEQANEQIDALYRRAKLLEAREYYKLALQGDDPKKSIPAMWNSLVISKAPLAKLNPDKSPDEIREEIGTICDTHKIDDPLMASRPQGLPRWEPPPEETPS